MDHVRSSRPSASRSPSREMSAVLQPRAVTLAEEAEHLVTAAQLEAERTAAMAELIAENRAILKSLAWWRWTARELLVRYVKQEQMFMEVDGEYSDDMTWIHSTSNDHVAVGSGAG